MKIIITESQYNLLQETFGRDRWDAEYSDEYPKYKDMLITAIKMEITASGQTEETISLGNSDGKVFVRYRNRTRSLYYDYNWAEDIEKLIIEIKSGDDFTNTNKDIKKFNKKYFKTFLQNKK